MVKRTLCNLIAAYKYAISSGQRIFSAPVSKTNLNFVKYLHASGYICGYHQSADVISIYPNHKQALVPDIQLMYRPSRPIYFTAQRVRKELRSGQRYWLYTHEGHFRDSYECVLLGYGGLVIAKLF